MSERQARARNAGLIGSENRLRGSYQNLIQSLGESGVTDAAAKSMESVAGGLKAIAATNPDILKWSTYAVAAAAVIGPLTWAIGKIVGAAGTLARVGMAAAAVPGAGAAAAVLTGVAGAEAIKAGAKPFVDAAKGVNWTPHDAEAIKLLEQDLAEAERRGANARRGSKVPGMADTLASPFDSQAQDLRNRIQAGYDNFAHRTGRLSEATRDEIMRRAEVDVAAARKVELDGKVQIDNRVTVEHSPDFWTRMKSTVTSFFSNGVRSEGTTGLTGTAMPEAAP